MTYGHIKSPEVTEQTRQSATREAFPATSGGTGWRTKIAQSTTFDALNPMYPAFSDSRDPEEPQA